jgi:hypothetical protein
MAALSFHTAGIERRVHAAPRGSADGGMVARATGCVSKQDDHSLSRGQLLMEAGVFAVAG